MWAKGYYTLSRMNLTISDLHTLSECLHSYNGFNSKRDFNQYCSYIFLY